MTKRPDFVNKLLCLFVKEVSSFCPSAEVISSSFELQKNSILKCILTKKKPIIYLSIAIAIVMYVAEFINILETGQRKVGNKCIQTVLGTDWGSE